MGMKERTELLGGCVQTFDWRSRPTIHCSCGDVTACCAAAGGTDCASKGFLFAFALSFSPERVLRHLIRPDSIALDPTGRNLRRDGERLRTSGL